MIKFQKIGQFREVIRSVRDYMLYKNGECDEDGVLIEGQPHTWEQPKLTFKGSVKLHGTNSSWVYNIANKTLTPQSRNRVLTVENDNAGFAAWTKKYEKDIISVIREYSAYLPTLDGDIIIYGEWAGPGIQNGVAISEIERKSFFVFEVMHKIDDCKKYINPEHLLFDMLKDVYVLSSMWRKEIEIDFENPEMVQNQLGDITTEVENECPIGKLFNISGIGEGVVWSCYPDNNTVIRFKVKGEKHSVSKVKTLASADVEKIAKVADFVDKVVTEARLQQGLDYLKEMGHELSPKSTGHFVKWVTSDIFAEESDTIAENELESKLVGKEASNQARKWFFKQI